MNATDILALLMEPDDEDRPMLDQLKVSRR